MRVTTLSLALATIIAVFSLTASPASAESSRAASTATGLSQHLPTDSVCGLPVAGLLPLCSTSDPWQ